MKTFPLLYRLLLITSVCSLCFVVACGGSASRIVDEPSIEILQPSNDQVFQAGEVLLLSLQTENFSLGPPVNIAADDPRSILGSLARQAIQEDAHQDEHGHEEEGGESPDLSSHEHSEVNSNPAARQGHVHVYLDDAEGSDTHITAWVYEIPIHLPSDLNPGVHSLRVELRDDSHTLVDSRFDEVVFFEVLE